MSDYPTNNNQPNMVQAIRQGLIRPEREGEYWTNDERDRLRRQFDEGVDITAISVLLKRREDAIMQQIKKMDLYGRKTNPRRVRMVKEHICLCSTCSAADTLCLMRLLCDACERKCEDE